MTDNLSFADIREALEHAAADLRKVDDAWTEDASAVASAAVSVDANRLRHLADPARLQELRQALAIVEGLLDDGADGDDTN